MTAGLKTHAWELMALALFYFVFLGGEYFFDAMLASFMSPADVVLNQGMILGASAVGFCCFEPFSRTPRRVRLGCSIVSMVAGFGGIAVLFAQPSLRRGNRHTVRRQRGVLGSPCSIDRSRRRRSCAPCGLPSVLCGRTLRRCDSGRRWTDAKRAGYA